MAVWQIAQKTERAARQQGSSFLRENSSNGSKTIRTFWLHSRGTGRECQGEIEEEISYLLSIICQMFPGECAGTFFALCSPVNLRYILPFQGVS
jgi:hypothetical protein